MLEGFFDLLCPRACFRCDRPLTGEAGLCRRCVGAFSPPEVQSVPGLESCAAGAAYRGEVEGWVRAFKYPTAMAFPDPAPEAILTELMLQGAARMPGPTPDRIVPVPLHPRRLRGRGFNPAGRLGRSVARRLGVAFDPVALERLRDTPSQTGLDARARRRNVAGAFCRRAGAPPLPPRIWLVDDVVTTGATLACAARALRAAGASEVSGLCAAATPWSGADGS